MIFPPLPLQFVKVSVLFCLYSILSGWNWGRGQGEGGEKEYKLLSMTSSYAESLLFYEFFQSWLSEASVDWVHTMVSSYVLKVGELIRC